MPSSTSTLPEWEEVLSWAAHLQRIFPDAVLVGGTAAAIYAEHRLSTDADHVLTDLRARFDLVLAELESVAGWKTARVRRPVQILGSLDGIETGVRQLIREQPLETAEIERFGQRGNGNPLAEAFNLGGLQRLLSDQLAHAGLNAVQAAQNLHGPANPRRLPASHRFQLGQHQIEACAQSVRTWSASVDKSMLCIDRSAVPPTKTASGKMR